MSVKEIKWRGPRPLASGDILRGRDRDLKNLVDKVRNFDVLEITAPSGVGKSSFIAAGLIPRLRLAGTQVLPLRRDWSWPAVLTLYDHDAKGAVEAEMLYRLCLGWPKKEEDDRSLGDRFTELSKKGRPVVVLDQLEELIRYRERLGEALLQFIGRQAAALGVTHVIAGRSEYRDQFRPAEDASSSFFHWGLPEINEPDAVDDIIKSPVLDAGLEIENTVIKNLRKWWLSARSDSPNAMGSVVGRADVGLLHLQGVLWLFKEWLMNEPAMSEITEDHLERFTTKYVGSFDDKHGPLLYRAGLVEYIRKHCATAHEPEHWSPGYRTGRGVWTNGPRLMMARSAHLLSVLGYKVAQSRSGMFRTVLAEDLDPAAARAVAATAESALSEDWLAEVVEMHSGNLAVEGRGLARGWDPDDVLGELLAAAAQAWTAASGEANILRRFVQKDDEVYELVHDGMGTALQEWASGELSKARALIGVITPRTGRSFSVPIRPDTFVSPAQDVVPHFWDGIVTLDGQNENRTVQIDGVGWDASAISSSMTNVTLNGWILTGALFKNSTMKDVVFRDCEMKGAAFLDVTMEGVRFEDCDLRGAAFRICRMSDVEFVQARNDNTSSKLSSLDMLIFEGCVATGGGVSLASSRETVGLIFKGVTGESWVIEGSRVRHLALHADGQATFWLRKGTYEHITVEPPELAIVVDPGAMTAYSGITQTRDAPA